MDYLHTTPTARGKYTAKELNKLKVLSDEAVKYYQENNIPKKMETILNLMFFEKPHDEYGYMADYFSEFAFPIVISKLKAEVSVNSQNHPILKVSVFFNKLKHDKLLAMSCMSGKSLLSLDGSSTEERNAYSVTQLATIKESINLIKSKFSPQIIGQQPCQQWKIDTILSEYFEELSRQAELTEQLLAAQCLVEQEEVNVSAAANKEIDNLKKPLPNKSPKGGKGGKPQAIAMIPDEPRPPMQIGAVLKSCVSSVISKAAANLDNSELYVYLRKYRAKHRENARRCPDANANFDLLQYEGQPAASISDGDIGATAASTTPVDPTLTPTALGDPSTPRSAPLTHSSENEDIVRIINGGHRVNNNNVYLIPQLISTILGGGKPMPGKHNSIKEYMLITRANLLASSSMKIFSTIYEYCAKSLSKTTISGRFTNDNKILCPAFDKAELGLDLLQEAIIAMDLVPGEDIFIALNCATFEYYDNDKGRYEIVQGQMKNAEELVDYWIDIVKRYPAVVMLIDPIRKVDKEAWNRLCTSLSETCYITADYNLPSAKHILLEKKNMHAASSKPTPFTPPTNAACLRFEGASTITEFIDATNLLLENNNEIVMCSTVPSNLDSFIVDLAVAMNFRFLRIGSPLGGDNVHKLNRLRDIETILLNGTDYVEMDKPNAEEPSTTPRIPPTSTQSRLKFTFAPIVPRPTPVQIINDVKPVEHTSHANSAKKR